MSFPPDRGRRRSPLRTPASRRQRLHLEVLEERRLLSVSNGEPEADPLVLTGLTEFRVNTSTAGDQQTPEIETFADGSYVISWNDAIFQRYAADGTPLGGERLMYGGATGDTAIAADGSFAGVYAGSRLLLARRFDSAGSQVGSELLIEDLGSGVTATYVRVKRSGDAGYVVAWTTSENKTYARRFDPAFNPLGNAIDIASVTLANPAKPFLMESNATGDVAMAYLSTSSSIHARVFRADGSDIGPVYVPRTPFAAAPKLYAVTLNESGEFAVGYTEPRGKVQRYDAAGIAIGTPIEVVGPAPENFNFFDVSLEPGGGFVVAADNRITGFEPGGASSGQATFSVALRRYNANGTPQELWTLANSYVVGHQRYPVVATTSGAEFIFAWVDDRQDGSGNGVYARQFVDNDLPVVSAVRTAWGAPIADGSVQPSQLDSLKIGFSRPMIAALFDAPGVVKLYDDGVDISGQIVGVEYGNEVATVHFASPLRGEGYQLMIPAFLVADTLGRALDGDANGTLGGDFVLSFDVRQGVIGLGPEIIATDVADGSIRPFVAVNEQGEFAISFSGGSNSFARMFSDDGVPLGDSYVVSAQQRPFDLKPLDNGEYLALMHGQATNVLYRLGQAGVVDSSQFSLGNLKFPYQLATNGSNTIVLWDDSVNVGSDFESDVMASRFDANDNQIGTPFPINDPAPGAQTSGSIAMLDSGEFVVVWADGPADLSDLNLVARFFAADGTPLSAEVPVNSDTTGRQVYSEVAIAPDGTISIAWLSEGQEGSDGVYLRRFTKDLVPLGDEVRISPLNAVAAAPRIAVDDSGRTLVTWAEDATKIVARAFNSDGLPLGPQFQVNSQSVGPYSYLDVDDAISLSMNGVGDAVIAWKGVRAQRLSLGHPPVLDLNGAAAGADYQADVQLNNDAFAIVDAGLAIRNATTENLVGGSIVIDGALPGDILSVDTSGTNIVANYQAGVLSLTGVDTVAHYEQVLRTATLATIAARTAGSTFDVHFTIDDGFGTSTAATTTVGVYVPGSAIVDGRYLRYANSKYAVPNAPYNDPAIPTFKHAYLPGQGLATFDSVSSYSRGINNIVVDLYGAVGTPTLEDFTFRMGTSNDLGTWTAAPAPISLTVRADVSPNGQDRIEIVWPNGVINNTWLEVTVAANSRTGLQAPDVFYYGSRIGDSGLGNPATLSITNTYDQVLVRNSFAPGQNVNSLLDFNHDGLVNVGDDIIARNNIGVLPMLNLPGPTPLVATPLVVTVSAAEAESAAVTTPETDLRQAVASALVTVVDATLPAVVLKDELVPVVDASLGARALVAAPALDTQAVAAVMEAGSSVADGVESLLDALQDEGGAA